MSVEDQFERRVTRGRAIARAVGELGKVEETYLVVMFGGDVMAEVLLDMLLTHSV